MDLGARGLGHSSSKAMPVLQQKKTSVRTLGGHMLATEQFSLDT